MTHSTSVLSKTIKNVLATAGGAVSVAAVVGAIWGLVSIFGAVVTRITIMLGGTPGMWLASMYADVNDPTYASVGFGFLCLVGSSLYIVVLVFVFLHRIGKAVAAMFYGPGAP